MSNVFEITDKTGRKIKLTDVTWRHIQKEHPLIDEEEIKKTLINPLRITQKSKNKVFYYQYFKFKKLPYRYLRVIVRYLNGNGFVITAYFVKHMD